MPRMSEADKQKSHKRIIDAAAHLFRENGVGATSVSDVMQAAGLTHGGFYRHFSSKEELVTAAFGGAIDELLAGMENVVTEKEQGQLRDEYISRYLSLDHVKSTGGGCPFVAIGAEISRLGSDVKSEASKAIDRTSMLLDDPRGHDTRQGVAIMAMLVGTITIARLAKSENEAFKIIEAGRIAVDRMRVGWNIDV